MITVRELLAPIWLVGITLAALFATLRQYHSNTGEIVSILTYSWGASNRNTLHGLVVMISESALTNSLG